MWQSVSCMDEDTYRQLLNTYAGVESTREMNLGQLNQILDAMKKIGFKVRTQKKEAHGHRRPVEENPALWLEMADEGFIRDRTERAINVYVHRITGVSRLDWLNTSAASRVIETLKQWQTRERKALEELQGAK
jgi:phage gp16-like protein